MVTKVRKHSYESIKSLKSQGQREQRRERIDTKGETANRRAFHLAASLCLASTLQQFQSGLSAFWTREKEFFTLIDRLLSTTGIIRILVETFGPNIHFYPVTSSFV